MNRPDVYGADKRLHIERQDREAMRRKESWSGIFGFNPQDGAMTMNMGGPIFDRTREHLVPADYAIIRMRRILIDAARAVEDGREPVGISLDLDARGIECGSGRSAEDANASPPPRASATPSSLCARWSSSGASTLTRPR